MKSGEIVALKKRISVTIPCYNEEKSITEMYDRLIATFQKIPQYDYEIIFVDDCSPDSTWEKIAQVCQSDKKVRGVHNITNFGPIRNIFQTIKYGTGDAVFILMGDLQQPPEKLLDFVSYWEKGYSAVIGTHSNTEDHGLLSCFRSIYYRLMNSISTQKMIPKFSYFGLFDHSIIEILGEIDDQQPFFPGILAEYCNNIKVLNIPQEESRRGHSGQNFWKKYDQALVSITSYTKLLMRLATFVSALIGIVAVVFSVYVLAMKLLHWNTYPLGIPTVIIGIFFLGAIQLFFLGILGEYVLSINERSMKKPLTKADILLNFGKDDII